MVWQARPGRPRGEHLDEPRLLVVDLVAVGVDAQAVPVGEVDGDLHGAHAVLAGVLEVGDRTDHVDATPGRLGEQLLAVRERADALLGEGHQLQVHHVADPVTDLEESVERDE